jgi:hypothetical protein
MGLIVYNQFFFIFEGIKMLVYQYTIWESGELRPQRITVNHLLSLTEVQEKNPYITKIYLEAIIDV